LELKAVVFDLGGTLISYTGSYAKWPDLEKPGFEAAYHYLMQNGVELPSFRRFCDAGFAMLPERWRQAAAGVRNLRLVDLLEEVLQSSDHGNVPTYLLAQAAEVYQSAVRAQATLMPAAAETLSQVSAAGYRLGLLSNTMFTGEAHRADLERFNLLHYFDTMLFSADVDKWKPNAAPFLQVLDDLGVEPEAAVYIGDDPASDVVGGRRAGMVTIHIKSSQRFGQPDGAEPHAQIHSLAQLFPLLSAWRDGAP
jgi:putative hydrolase of the HAD superfamily